MSTILFLHGWGGNEQSFGVVPRYFARTHQVLCPALPCPPDMVWTLDDYARALEQFLVVHQVQHCLVVAHSFGARVVAVLNAQRPDLFTKIVVTGGAGLRRWSLRVWWKIRWYKFKKALFGRARGGSADYQALTPAGKITFQNIVRRDLTPEIRQIKAPLLLLYGTRDRQTPPWQARRWHALVSHSRLRWYRGGGHFLFLTHPARFVKEVAQFFDE